MNSKVTFAQIEPTKNEKRNAAPPLTYVHPKMSIIIQKIMESTPSININHKFVNVVHIVYNDMNYFEQMLTPGNCLYAALFKIYVSKLLQKWKGK